MSLSAKIELENRIFKRAALVQSPVDSKQGGLVSPSNDLELQTLLYVYNAHFRAENWRQFCPPGEVLEAYRNYCAQGPARAGFTPVWGPNELAFELILSEEK